MNASGNRDGLSKAQVAFLDFVAGKEPTDEFTNKINDEVVKARNKEEWRAEYMTLLQRDREKFEEGKAEGKTNELVSLVEEGLLDIEIAAKRLNITVDEFEKLIDANESNDK
ncbi:MAG: hypothetical protein K6A23_00725 [Butyrivibrio sp.]|nr:hypothetical protein [Butyrivibrio sp.]